MKEKVTCLVNTDLFSRYGFGIHEYHKLNELWKRGYINRILCRDKLNSDNYLDSTVETVLPLGNVFPRALTAIDITTLRKLPLRLWNKILFDKFASTKLTASGILLTSESFPNSIKRAKVKGCKVVLSAGAHPNWIKSLIQEEYSRINMKGLYSNQEFMRQVESVENADLLLLPSDFAKTTMIKNGVSENKLVVQPFGVNSNFFHPPLKPRPTKKINYLFLADMTLLKGVQYLLDAWGQLERQNELADAQLIICGGISPEVRHLVSNSKKIRGVFFSGHVSDVRSLYNSASVFVFPSLLEGMARVTSEAMASGLPVITTPNAGSVVRDGKDGFIIPIRNVQKLKEKILYFYHNRDEIVHMGRNARSRVEYFNWDRYSKGVANTIEHFWQTCN